MREALKNVEDYLYEISSAPKGQTDKVLKESEFLISGVQNIFSFLENQKGDLYQSLVDDYTDVNKAFQQAQTHLQKTVEFSDTKQDETQEALSSEIEEQDLFLNNLIEVKKDHSYELFYMSDEENKRFYNDSLAQIIYKQNKLHETVHENDPLTKTLLWNSNEVKKMASLLVTKNEESLRLFYQDALKHLNIKSIEKAHNAVMALFLSQNEVTAVCNSPKKNNLLYFNDFLLFLREAWKVSHNDLENLSQEQKQAMLLTATLGASVFESRLVFEDVANYLYSQIKRPLHPEGEKKSLSSGQYIMDIYEELYRMFAKFPNGPLFKAIDRILDSGMNIFDPLILGMFPSVEGSLKLGELTIDIIRSPSPISQSSILYATCNEEFLGFLATKAEQGTISLILNIQNRVSRKERARCRVLEEALEQVEYASHAYIFSFPDPEELLDNLEKAYGEIETFAEFFTILKNEFHKPEMTSSFFLSPSLKDSVHEFLEHCLPVLKDTFFSKKKILFKNDKLLLLYLISYLLVFKNIENVNPNTIVVISKDGLDYASVFIAGLAFFSKDSCWDEHSLKLLITKILAPTLVARDRLVFASYIEIFSKFLNCLRRNRQTLSTLRPFFHHNIEDWEMVNYLNNFIEGSHKHNV
ncbi:calcium-binding protein [Chlamydia sp. 17-3921]|uniref:calcium-binding protein n=2 Tax=Chlamydia sp. 17-3921 TaxID=2675798 RepID=UPI001918195E|nr:calcium-binding protein [Chlamydia sp. 17-3921]